MARPDKVQELIPSLWRLLRHFWPYARRHRLLLGGAFLALLARVGLRILEPWPLKFVFDRIIPVSAPESTEVGLLDTLDPFWLLALCALSLVAITALRSMAVYWSKVGFALVGHRVLARVRGELYRHLQFLSLRFHKRSRSGDLVVRLMGDVGLLREVVVTAFLPLLANILILLGMFSLMFWFSWKLTLLALLTLPLFWIRTVRLTHQINEVARKQRRRRGNMTAAAVESISAIETIQALSLQDTFSDSFASQDKKDIKQGVKAKRLAARLQRTVALVVAIASALVLFFGAREVLRGFMTPGDLLVFLAYLKTAFKPAQDFAKYSGRLAKASAAGERILDILEESPEIVDSPDAIPAPPFRGEVQFEGVTFGYEPDLPVLRDLNLHVEAGERIAILGPSGAGKTTLVSLMLRLYALQEGKILIDGKDVRDYTVESLRSQFSMVLQDNVLFAASVRENLTWGLLEVPEKEVRAAARLANADDFIEALPDGYDTVVGERGATLSFGQRQRLAIARAALRKTPFLILDEPSAGLDEANRVELNEALGKLSTDRTSFVITHDLRFGLAADRILCLEDGALVEKNPSEPGEPGSLSGNSEIAADTSPPPADRILCLEDGALVEKNPSEPGEPGSLSGNSEIAADTQSTRWQEAGRQQPTSSVRADTGSARPGPGALSRRPGEGACGYGPGTRSGLPAAW